jgi:hypothetical protein
MGRKVQSLCEEEQADPRSLPVCGPSRLLLLTGGKRQWYKRTMRGVSKLSGEGLQRSISAEELQIMLGDSQAFCSWDATNSGVRQLMDRWPYLFSHPLSAVMREISRRQQKPPTILNQTTEKAL